MILNDLNNKKLLDVSYPWVVPNTQYLTLMGSVCYGVSNDMSDVDLYGFTIPPKDMIFPHLRGHIEGFGQQIQRFEQFQQHHIKYTVENGTEREYDISIYNIVRYFQLAMENNPNILDSLFTPFSAIYHITPVGTLVRENRKLFLHKGAWYKYKGYAFAQMNKLKTSTPIGKRKETVETYGFDVKFAYHVVRLLQEIEIILTEHDLDITRNAEQLKAIRRGEWTIDEITSYFIKKESELETLYTSSTLRHKPDEKAIKDLLVTCLEQHYGDMGECLTNPDEVIEALNKIQDIINQTKSRL